MFCFIPVFVVIDDSQNVVSREDVNVPSQAASSRDDLWLFTKKYYRWSKVVIINVKSPDLQWFSSSNQMFPLTLASVFSVQYSVLGNLIHFPVRMTSDKLREKCAIFHQLQLLAVSFHFPAISSYGGGPISIYELHLSSCWPRRQWLFIRV